MTNEEVKALIAQNMQTESVTVEGDGYHYQATVVSSEFEGLRSVKRQQMVYATVQQPIADGSVHALSIKAYTPEEFAAL